MRTRLCLHRVQVMDNPVHLITAQRVLVEIVREVRPHAEVVRQRHKIGMQGPSGADGLGSGGLVLCRLDKAGIGNEPDHRQNADNGNDGQHFDHRKTGDRACRKTKASLLSKGLWHWMICHASHKPGPIKGARTDHQKNGAR